jgi:selenocysteine-specific elongation factor
MDDRCMVTASDPRFVLIGTAGHIDHGKTRLVGRLTGIDTDRLPEEKARGISIDLGFAHWDAGGFRFGVVDVPGHERFVRNMVAGATGVNAALLVVAADDGVMPQTREHLDIMELLGLRTGVIAITKVDLVEPELVELVREEIEELVAGTFLEGCPIIPVSSETGEGLDELRGEIVRIAGSAEWPQASELFRMPIDRVFSVPGHGTVVTGSVLSGEVHPGDTLELLPQQRELRVRGVQSHRSGVEGSGARRRTAVNLAGIKVEELHRGFELATPGYLQPARRLLVELRSLPGSPIILKDRLHLSLHLGTGETLARVILKGTTLGPGERGYAELRTKQPVVAAYGQRFILRRASPGVTVAGGTVLDPQIAPGRRIREPRKLGERLDSMSEIDRLSAVLSQQDRVEDSPRRAVWRAGIPGERYSGLLRQLAERGEIISLGNGAGGWRIHGERLRALSRSVLRVIKSEIDRHQPRRSLPRPVLLGACRALAPADLLDAVFAELIRSKQLVEVGANLGPADVQVKLTKNQQQTREALLQAIAGGGLTPPTVKELAATLKQKPEHLQPLLNLCREEGLLVPISSDLYYTPEALERARETCRTVFDERGEATMSELRERWAVTRKFSVPLCEYFDSIGVTAREGDVRRAGPVLRGNKEEAIADSVVPNP